MVVTWSTNLEITSQRLWRATQGLVLVQALLLQLVGALEQLTFGAHTTCTRNSTTPSSPSHPSSHHRRSRTARGQRDALVRVKPREPFTHRGYTHLAPARRCRAPPPEALQPWPSSCRRCGEDGGIPEQYRNRRLRRGSVWRSWRGGRHALAEYTHGSMKRGAAGGGAAAAVAAHTLYTRCCCCGCGCCLLRRATPPHARPWAAPVSRVRRRSVAPPPAAGAAPRARVE